MISRKGMVSYFIGLVIIILECFPKCPAISQIPLCHPRACCQDSALPDRMKFRDFIAPSAPLVYCCSALVPYLCDPHFQHSLSMTASHKSMGNLKKTDMIANAPS